MPEHQDIASTRYLSLRVLEVIDETPDARSFVFEIPEALEADFTYQPGQFLTLRLPWGDDFLLRCYSMSSSPEIDRWPKVTVKRVQDGRASNWLCDKIKPGDTVQVMRPSGIFVPKSYDDNLLLCAGGSGITPIFSILQTALKQGKGRIRLIYANRDEASVIFREKLKHLAESYPGRLEVFHLLDSLQGICTEPQLAFLSQGLPKAKAYICGPGPFMDAMESALSRTTIGPSDIFIERFTSLPSENEAEAMTVQPVTKADFSEAEITLDLDGEQYKISCGSDEVILEAAERQGLSLPFSCRVGLCSSCMCVVTEGEVELLNNEVLDERDLARGTILTCQAVPRSKTLNLRYT